MKKLLLVLLLSTVSPLYAKNATAFCSKSSTRAYIRTHIGNPKYVTQYSREEFLKRENIPPSPYVLGLTISELQMGAQIIPSVLRKGDKYCVSLKDVEITLFYPNLVVYIDKKYPYGSCEYDTIKEHENYHVSVSQQALTFFKPDLEKRLKSILSSIPPTQVNSADQAAKTIRNMEKTLLSKLTPLIAHINKKIKEKNAAIDTKEMYQKTTALCNNW